MVKLLFIENTSSVTGALLVLHFFDGQLLSVNFTSNILLILYDEAVSNVEAQVMSYVNFLMAGVLLLQSLKFFPRVSPGSRI